MKIGILASGIGSTAEPILKWASVVITNNPEAGVIEHAKKHGVDYVVMPRKEYQVFNKNKELDVVASRKRYGKRMVEILENHDVDFVSSNGFSILIPENVIERFKGRITNSHPASLEFGGKGMHGLAVHEAVLHFARWVKRPFMTQVTIHRVKKEYDDGEVLAYSKVGIKADDTSKTLQQRVKEVEILQNKKFWTKVEQSGKLIKLTSTNRESVVYPSEAKLLKEAIEHAIEKYPRG